MVNNFGWTGTVLRIDLATGKAAKAASQKYTEDFIGGRAMASRIYWDEVSQGIDAFSPENVLLIMPGPLAGTPATACSRWVMAAKSPYYYPDQYSFGNCGGFFGAAVKFAGYDGLIIKGKAKTASYLLIENDRVELRDATGLRGLATDETLVKLKAAHGENCPGAVHRSCRRKPGALCHCSHRAGRHGIKRHGRGHGVKEPEGYRG